MPDHATRVRAAYADCDVRTLQPFVPSGCACRDEGGDCLNECMYQPCDCSCHQATDGGQP